MRSSQALQNSLSRNITADLSKSKTGLMASLDKNPLELSNTTSVMNNSRFVANHNSTNMAVDSSYVALRASK